MSLAVADLLTAGTETGKNLPGEPWMIGLGAFGLLVLLLLVTLTFGKDR
jgi:hypothetical protein